MGGEIYAITSQTDVAATKAKTMWGVCYESRADPKIEIAKYLKEQGLLNIFVNLDPPPPALAGGDVPGGNYEVGVYQPAVLVLTQDFRPLFRFASLPSLSNAGGAAGRPTADTVMASIRPALSGEASVGVVDWKPQKIPPVAPILLVMYIFAHGSFIRPIPPALAADGSEPPYIKNIALGKLLLATASFTALLRRHPKASSLAAAAYGAYVYVFWGTWIKKFFSPAENALTDEPKKSC